MKKFNIIFILIIAFGCVDNNKNDKNTFFIETNLFNDKTLSNQHNDDEFDIFIKKFTSDKLFRELHVEFPLKGFNSDETDFNSRDSIYLWSKKDWEFYADEDFSANRNENIKSKITKKGTTIIYHIYKENSGYNIQYIFKKTDNKWLLIFYSYKNL